MKRHRLEKVLAPVMQYIKIYGTATVEIPSTPFGLHNTVVRLLAAEKLLDKVEIRTPLFSFRLRHQRQNGLTTIRSYRLIRRADKDGKYQKEQSLRQKLLTKHEQKELVDLYRYKTSEQLVQRLLL